MPRMIDLIRTSRMPSNMMQFAARGALSVPPDENIEILVYLAKHNQVFGDVARMTLAGWDEKASLAAASDPKTSQEVLDYLVSPENIRPLLLPGLLENPSVGETQIVKFAISASGESIAVMLRSPRVRASAQVLEVLRANPYLKQSEAAEVAELLAPAKPLPAPVPDDAETAPQAEEAHPVEEANPAAELAVAAGEAEPISDESVTAYLAEHATEIVAEQDKPFQPVGGIVDLLGADYFPVSQVRDVAPIGNGAGAAPALAREAPKPRQTEPRRENTLQKINRLDVKGRIQLALKGNKEERSILIRDGTKVVALAVLDAPKLTDGEVEKIALQKNVLEAVLRQIPLKRRFMKNYAIVRNLVFNPRTPLDLSLSLLKHLLAQDLKNLSANKEIADTLRKLALKMFKQKMESAKKK